MAVGSAPSDVTRRLSDAVAARTDQLQPALALSAMVVTERMWIDHGEDAKIRLVTEPYAGTRRTERSLV